MGGFEPCLDPLRGKDVRQLHTICLIRDDSIFGFPPRSGPMCERVHGPLKGYLARMGALSADVRRREIPFNISLWPLPVNSARGARLGMRGARIVFYDVRDLHAAAFEQLVDRAGPGGSPDLLQGGGVQRARDPDAPRRVVGPGGVLAGIGPAHVV